MKTMKQIVAGLLALGLMLLPVQAVAQTYFWWTVVDEFGRAYPSQTISCSVYDLASHGAKELFLLPTLARHAGVLTTMPLLSDDNSRLHFYSDSTADIRVVCYYARGGAATDLRLSRFTHTVMIDRQGRKVVRFPIVTNTAATNTGIWLPQGAYIRDIIVQNVAFGGQIEAPASDVNPEPHLNVGFRGAHAVSVAHSLVDRLHLARQPEWINVGTTGSSPRRGAAVTGGTGAAYHYTAFGVHLGEAMFLGSRGAVSGPSANLAFVGVKTGYLIHVAGGLELTYQTSNTPGISGHLFILYDSLHTGVSTTPVGR